MSNPSNVIDIINQNRDKANKIVKGFYVNKPILLELKDSLAILQNCVHKDSSISYKIGNLEATKK